MGYSVNDGDGSISATGEQEDHAGPPAPPARRLTVGLLNEGSYPHQRGGVGTWCDMLVRGVPEVSFVLVSLVANPNVEISYELPDNVADVVTVPLWGIDGVLERRRDLGVAALMQRRRLTPDTVISQRFLPLFRELLDLVWHRAPEADATIQVLRALADYFRVYDYDTTMRSQPVWRAFVEMATPGLERVETVLGEPDPVPLSEVTQALRLLARWLTVLTVELPPLDIVHSMAAGLTGIIGIVAADDPGTTFLLSEHGIYLRERLIALAEAEEGRFSQLFQAQFVQRITEASYRCASLITPCSDANQRWERYAGARPASLQTVHNGVDASRFSPPEGGRDPDQPPTAVWLGRIDPLKDLETLIRAAGVVCEAVPDARFVLYGKAPEGNEWYYERLLELRAELGLEENVIFGGFTSSPAAAYLEGDFVVLSSISEGFPYTVVEAMMCARTVVGTNVGGVSEALEDVGYVVEPRNPEAFAAACLELMTDLSHAEALGREARQKALANFTLQQCNDTFLGVYRRLAR